MRTLLNDIRFGFLVLRRTPTFSLIALLTLILGIGANCLIFSLVNALAFRGPFRNIDNVVVVRNRYPNISSTPASYPEYLTWREQTHGFSRMATYFLNTLSYSGNGDPRRLYGSMISQNYFEMFGTQPRLGRFFLGTDQHKGSAPVCLISEALWAQEFNSDLSIFGRTMTLDGTAYNIVGIVPSDAPDFRTMPKTEVWLPLEASPPFQGQSENYLWVLGQLKAGVGVDAAINDLQLVQSRLNAQFPDDKHDIYPTALSDFVLGKAKRVLAVLLITVALVLLIACANVANMVLARSSNRVKELAIREAMGASRLRLVRQMLSENLILTVNAAFAAVWLAYLLAGVLLRFWPSTLRRPDAVEIDWRVVAFTVAVSLLSTVLFGLAPAVRLSRLDVNRILREAQGLQVTSGPGSIRLRNAFVVSEIAAATVLLIAAVLTLRSFAGLLQVSPGFQPDKIITMSISLPERKYLKPEQRLQFFDELLRRVAVLPGISSAAATSFLPLAGGGRSGEFSVPGRVFDPSQRPWAEDHYVTPGYFETMRIPLIRGRWFTTQDRINTVKTTVINQTAAKQLWPGEDALGKVIQVDDSNDTQTVIGIVGDVRGASLEAAPRMQLYFSVFQYPAPTMAVVARTNLDKRSTEDSFKSAVFALDRDQPISSIAWMNDIIENSTSDTRSSTVLLGLFASLAMALALLGVYGVMAYTVTQRNHEFGIRIALGAQRPAIMRMVMGAGLRLVALGTVVGVVASLAFVSFLRSLLFGISPVSAIDPVSYIGVITVLLAGAILASYLPAYRATKADPMMMLRHD